MSTPLSDEQIRAATIGEPNAVHGTILLVPYDPAWPAIFANLARRIREALGSGVLLLEHVGSTSVPGLTAKPIIDVLLAVKDSSDEAAYLPPLERAGFVLRIREPDWYQHRVLKGLQTRCNLHVFSAGCEEIGRMLRFRNRLRTHPKDRLEYERTKRALATRTWKYVQNYADAKSSVIEEILARASAE